MSARSSTESPPGPPAFLNCEPTTRSRSESLKGRPRINTALTSVKTVALRPMPRESARTATAEYQGSLAMSCRAYRKSLSMVEQYGSIAHNVWALSRVNTFFANLRAGSSVSVSMTIFQKLFSKKAEPKVRVRVCVECGMPVAEHKDWCSIYRTQREMDAKARAARTQEA